jgi:hypothetical protein
MDVVKLSQEKNKRSPNPAPSLEQPSPCVALATSSAPPPPLWCDPDAVQFHSIWRKVGFGNVHMLIEPSIGSGCRLDNTTSSLALYII